MTPDSSLLTPRSLILACGADLKGGFAVARGDRVDLFKGFGDLSDPDHFDAWAVAIEGALAGGAPDVVVVDAHPLYLSRHHGMAISRRTGARLVEVQHHHAHAEAALACDEAVDPAAPALALVLDGTGYGLDGTIWGCEVLHRPGDGSFARLGHLRPVPCPGGDAVVKEPWRMAASWLASTGDDAALSGLRSAAGEREFDAVLALIKSGTPVLTSSAGRLFDAAAAILGVSLHAEREAEAAIALERNAASWSGEAAALPFAAADGVLDPAGSLAALAAERRKGTSVPLLAARFHATLVEGLAALVEAVRPPGVSRIALAGGCFLNGILRAALPRRLEALGLVPLLPPPEFCTDAVIARGQLRAVRSRAADAGR